MIRLLLVVAVVLALQTALGLPGAPPWSASILLPMVFVVGPPLLTAERRWPHAVLALGLAWDLMFEPVIGPGAIAWSATAVITTHLVPLVADRTPRAWFAFGGLGAVLLFSIRELTLMPLGLGGSLVWPAVGLSAALTATWCGIVGWIIAIDLPSRWRRRRSRKLR